MFSILSRVCAEFKHPTDPTQKYQITRNDRMVIKRDVPDWVKKDPMYAWMVKDGSIEEIQTITDQKRVEMDPTAGMAPDGKKIVPEDSQKKTQKGRKAASAKGNGEEPAVAPEGAAEGKNEGNDAP